MSDLVLQILDNLDLILEGEADPPNLPTDIAINCVSYELYSDILNGLAAKQLNIQVTLPSILVYLDPSVKLPSKISNLTRKVKKFIEKNPDGLQHPVDGLTSYDEDAVIDTSGLTDLKISISELTADDFTSASDSVNSNCESSVNLKIQHVLCLRSILRKHKLPWSRAVEWLGYFGYDITNVSAVSIANQWNRFQSKKSLLGHRREQTHMDSLLGTSYELPIPKTSDSHPQSENECKARPQAQLEMVRDTADRFAVEAYVHVAELLEELDSVLSENADLERKMAQFEKLEKVYNNKISEIMKLKEKLSVYQPRNVRKRTARRDAAINNLKKLVAAQDNDIKSLTSQLSCLEKQKQKLQKAKSYWKLKCNKLENTKGDTDVGDESELKAQVGFLENELQSLMSLRDESVSNCVETFSGGAFTDEVREVYMELLSRNVSLENCSHVVRTILERLGKLKVGRLPSKSTASVFQAEAGVISDIQSGMAMLNTESNTLHTDGTRKRFREYGGFQVSTGDGCYLLGMEEMLTGSTEQFLSALKKKLQDVAEALSLVSDDSPSKEKLYEDLFVSLKNTMTDRHIVNKTMRNEMEKIREEIFSKDDIWKNQSENEKKEMVKINGLFCGLHVVANLGTAAQSGLKKYESQHPNIETGGFATANSKSDDTVWIVSKAFTLEGDHKSGDAEEFREFLRSEHGLKSQLVNFAHNRFNVFFHNGGAVFFHREHIKDFIKNCTSKENRLMTTILGCLGSNVCLAGCRALGIIDKAITGPIWRILESKLNFLDMNSIWVALQDCLKLCVEDASSMLNGESPFVEQVRKDPMYEELFQKYDDMDELTKQALTWICADMLTVFNRQLSDQLPGGCLSNPSAKLQAETVSAPLHNKVSETVFSDLDREIKRAPQRSVLGVSGVTNLRHNKTLKFLNKLATDTKKKYFCIARKLGQRRKNDAFETSKVVRQQRIALQRKRRQKKEEEKQKKIEKDTALEETIRDLGGPWDSSEIDAQLLSKTQAQKLQDIKCQLQYLCKTKGVTLPNSTIGHWQVKGKKKTLEELTGDLKVATEANVELIEILKQKFNLVTPSNSSTVRQLEPVAADVADCPNPKKKCRRTVCISAPKPPDLSNTTFMVGEWVAVAYEDMWFPGEVLSIKSVEAASEDNPWDHTYIITANFMHPTSEGGSSFKWPGKNDISDIDSKFIFYKNIDIIPNDHSGRTWKLADIESIRNAYVQYSQAFFA